MVASTTSQQHAGTTPGDSFARLLERGAAMGDVTAHLDGLPADRRVAEVRAVGGRLQKLLWARARGHGAVDLASFVDQTGKTVIYAGKNSLPLFTDFEKRFFRGATGEVAGYNHNPPLVAFFTGPGYFVVEQAPEGELLFDYTRLPEHEVQGWPPKRPNSGLLAGVVYGGMKDYVRWVSRTTVIGAAFKGGKAREAYFLLTRA